MARNSHEKTVTKKFFHCSTSTAEGAVVREVTENITHLGLMAGRVLKGFGKVKNFTVGKVVPGPVAGCSVVDVVFILRTKRP